MDRQATTATPSLKRELEQESEDQNGARKVLVVEDKDVQSKSTTTILSCSMATQTFQSSKPRWRHDVFLSFRGEDTRKNFIDHLYFALKLVGIRTFRDDEKLPKGKTISTELLNAIHESRISVVVFSKDYASSSWCLDELKEIVHCSNNIGHIFLPVFYNMDPSDVRNQTKTFAEAFASHEEQFQTDMERVRRWKAALTQAGNIAGWHLQNDANGSESSLIEKIVEEILHKMSSREPPKCYCGLRTHLTPSWTDDNPGRRFFGCPRYGKQSPCNFFDWYDLPICERGAELILEMREEILEMREEIKMLEGQLH